MTTPSAADLGLCATCRWARRIESARGSQFLRCGRSDFDTAFPRYPRLPVRTCAGFEGRWLAADARGGCFFGGARSTYRFAASRPNVAGIPETGKNRAAASARE